MQNVIIPNSLRKTVKYVQLSNIKKVIDWEQRRYEIAKDVLAGILGCPNTSSYSYEEIAVKYADSLIKFLKER